jgi:hypothetical protein
MPVNEALSSDDGSSSPARPRRRMMLALSGYPFQFPIVNCHALETVIASYAVPNEMNPVVVIGFHPDGGWDWMSALSAGIFRWKLV